MKKFLVFVVVLAVAVVGIRSGMKLIQKKREQEEKLPKAKIYPLRVKTILVKKTKTTLTLPYLALTKNSDDVKISSKIPARIEYIVENGKKVKKDEVVVKLDDKELSNKLEAINLNINSIKSTINAKNIALNNLIKTHDRTKALLRVNGASKEQFDKEVTEIESIKSAIKSLKYKIKELLASKDSIKNSLSYTTIKAPVDGVATRYANRGDVAMPGKALVSISSKSGSYLLVRLPQKIKANKIIFKGKKIKLVPLNTTYNGLLEYVANLDISLPSNQSVSVDCVVFDGVGYRLPHDSILDRDGKSYVLVYKGDKAYPKEVKIVSNAKEGVVVEGVKEGQSIVVEKQDILLKLLTGIKADAIKG